MDLGQFGILVSKEEPVSQVTYKSNSSASRENRYLCLPFRYCSKQNLIYSSSASDQGVAHDAGWQATSENELLLYGTLKCIHFFPV